MRSKDILIGIFLLLGVMCFPVGLFTLPVIGPERTIAFIVSLFLTFIGGIFIGFILKHAEQGKQKHIPEWALQNLKKGDTIVFEYCYNSETPKCIMMAEITVVKENSVLVHFMYGHHACAELIPKSEIIAVGDNSSNGKIPGISGKFLILKPEHPLLNK